jgi:hypothetical protein
MHVISQVNKCFLRLFLVGLALCVFGAQPVAACSIALSPNGWFRPVLSFDTHGLPTGLSVSFTGTAEGGELDLSNPTKTQLYILSKPEPSQDSIRPSADLPPGLVSFYMIVEDTWFIRTSDEWYLLEHQDGPRDGPRHAWRVVSPLLHIDSREHENTIRPADVALPAPHQAELPLVYADRLLRVPVEISYVLNPDYVPQTEVERADRAFRACNTMRLQPFLCLVALVVSPILIVGALVLTHVRRRRAPEGVSD